jgi:hypothetical protein
MHQLDSTPDDTLAGIRHKEQQYAELANDPEYIKARLLADAWCAAFVWEKKAPPKNNTDTQTGDNYFPLPMTDLLYRNMEDNPLADNLQAVRETVVALTDRYGFFHWHVAFPDVFSVPDDVTQSENEKTGWNAGFDVVIGNPPWDMIEFIEKEFFATLSPKIASTSNSSVRKKLISALKIDDPALYEEYMESVREIEGISHFVRYSNMYPLAAYGRLNTYPLFVSLARITINGYGATTLIVPSGIATDDTNKFLFQDIVENKTLVSLHDFENRERIFADVAPVQKFCLLHINGILKHVDNIDFMFFALNVGDLSNENKHFSLTPTEIALLNPNTKTCPVFQNKRDANVTKSIYHHIPIFVEESDQALNAWETGFKQGLFNSSSASRLFFTQEQLQDDGFTLVSNMFTKDEIIFVPLYEAKYTQQYDHRSGTFAGIPKANMFKTRAGTNQLSENDKQNPSEAIIPRYWINSNDVDEAIPKGWDKNWFMAFRKTTRPATDSRSTMVSIVPRYGITDKLPLILPSSQFEFQVTSLLANLNVFVLDFVTRLKIGGSDLSHFIMKQLPVIPPHTYTQILLDFIVPRVLELSYTAWDLQAFAQDVGWEGAPFIWDDKRRFLMRCELDALYFHLYQISREDVDYIMETFPIVKRKDIAKTADENKEGGEYITKRVILEMYDQMAQLPTMAVPAPKDEHSTYDVPDVSQWETWLNPPPADPSVAHGDTRE